MTHKVRKTNVFFGGCAEQREQRVLNGGIDPDTVPKSLCAEALPKFLDELVTLRKNFAEQSMMVSKADVSDAFRNVRVVPDNSHRFCYTV